MNLAERWFPELTTKWLLRGTHHSVRELAESITQWVNTWNEDPRPYVWHKTADEIFDSSPDIVSESQNRDTERNDRSDVWRCRRAFTNSSTTRASTTDPPWATVRMARASSLAPAVRSFSS
jgi:hypothetical protein